MLTRAQLTASALLIGTVATMTGCMTGPHILRISDDPYSCHEPGSDAWWAEKAALPPGVRQKVYKGKIWPARPRPNCDRQQFCHTFHSAHYWPLPYVCQDRAFVSGVWNDQIANGWIAETTIYDYHFDPDTNELTRPGRAHVRWILEVVPENRRMIFLQATPDSVLNQIRQENVRNAAMELAGNTAVPAIIVRTTRPLGRPAREVQEIRAKEIGSLPVPRLPGAAAGAAPNAGAGGATP